jgi:hypothetical protein
MGSVRRWGDQVGVGRCRSQTAVSVTPPRFRVGRRGGDHGRSIKTAATPFMVTPCRGPSLIIL